VSLAIGEVAQRAGVAVSAVRYYDRLGLITLPIASAGSAVLTKTQLGVSISFDAPATSASRWRR